MAEIRKKVFTSHKVLAVGIIIVGILAVAGLAINLVGSPQPSSPTQPSLPNQPSLPTQPSYPTAVPFTTNVTTSANGTQILISYNLVVEKKIVFFDVELQNKTAPLKLRPPYPMPKYRNGEYLPMMIILTPSGRLVAAVRICEPCATFSFHTDGAGKIICDKCHTSWGLETLKAVDDTGCGLFGPYGVSTTRSGDNIVINISTLLSATSGSSTPGEEEPPPGGGGCH